MKGHCKGYRYSWFAIRYSLFAEGPLYPVICTGSGYAVCVGLRLFIVILFAALPCLAQDNYEIQVYGSETVAPKNTMVELHSNFIFQGSKQTVDGVIPTEHQLHETVEITQGLTSWSEVGFYIFTCAQPNRGWQWVGDHIRPRVRAPESWHWPVGASLSVEFGYQRSQ